MYTTPEIHTKHQTLALGSQGLGGGIHNLQSYI